MCPRISIGRSVHPLVGPSIHPSVVPSVARFFLIADFDKKHYRIIGKVETLFLDCNNLQKNLKTKFENKILKHKILKPFFKQNLFGRIFVRTNLLEAYTLLCKLVTCSVYWLVRHAMPNHTKNLSKLHNCPCPTVRNWCCCVYGLDYPMFLPARLEDQPGRLEVQPASQPGLRAGWLGLRSGWMAQRR